MAILPGTANAHAMFGSAAPFWTGVLHVLVTPLALAAVAALVLALAEAQENAVLSAVAGSGLAAFGGAELSESANAIAAATVVAIALAVLMRRRPAALLSGALGIACGIAAGCAVGSDVPDWGGSLGVGVALLVLTSWGAAGLAQLQARFAELAWTGRRIAAATIALLTMASFIAAA